MTLQRRLAVGLVACAAWTALPAQGPAQPMHVPVQPGTSANAVVELTQATEAELDSVRGIGPGLSARLLAERARSPFRDWADLIARVKPMGPAQARRLSDAGLRVNGLPYPAPAP